MPELRLVVLALQDRLAYGTTFEAALSSLFNGTESSITQLAEQENTSSSTGAPVVQPNAQVSPTGSVSNTRNGEIQQAAQDLAEYQRLTAQGKLGEAGAKLDALKLRLNHLAGNREQP